MRNTLGWLCALALIGCNKDKDGDDDSGSVADDSATDDSGTDDSATDDSGTDDSGTDDSGVACTLEVSTIEPTEGSDWFYRDPLVVTFNEPGKGAVFTIEDASGTAVPFTPTWDAGQYSVQLAASLAGATKYTLEILACGVTTTVGFQTSIYGTPLGVEPNSLVGNTYLIDLSVGEFVRPVGLGAVMSLYIDAPLLFGVTQADASTITFLEAQGYTSPDGSFGQYDKIPTFEFPPADFTGAPYFFTSNPVLAIDFDDTAFTFYDFELSGTFAPDGTSIGGVVAVGNADTWNLGPMMELGDDPYAVCEFLKPFGITCETCPMGMKLDTCVPMEAHWDSVPLIPGLTLVPVVVDPKK